MVRLASWRGSVSGRVTTRPTDLDSNASPNSMRTWLVSASFADESSSAAPMKPSLRNGLDRIPLPSSICTDLVDVAACGHPIQPASHESLRPICGPQGVVNKAHFPLDPEILRLNHSPHRPRNRRAEGGMMNLGHPNRAIENRNTLLTGGEAVKPQPLTVEDPAVFDQAGRFEQGVTYCGSGVVPLVQAAVGAELGDAVACRNGTLTSACPPGRSTRAISDKACRSPCSPATWSGVEIAVTQSNVSSGKGSLRGSPRTSCTARGSTSPAAAARSRRPRWWIRALSRSSATTSAPVWWPTGLGTGSTPRCPRPATAGPAGHVAH